MAKRKKLELTGYQEIIREATLYSDIPSLEKIEDCMRDIIFHSTLDWQTREELKRGAIKAVKVLKLAGEL